MLYFPRCCNWQWAHDVSKSPGSTFFLESPFCPLRGLKDCGCPFFPGILVMARGIHRTHRAFIGSGWRCGSIGFGASRHQRSYLLLLLGMYDITIQALTKFSIPFLLPLAVGLFLGIMLSTKILEQAMTKQPTVTYLVIWGFILGSMLEIFPGLPTGWDLALCPLLFAAGSLSIFARSKWDLKKKQKFPLHLTIGFVLDDGLQDGTS